MKTNILDDAIALSDGDLLVRIPVLAVTERETAAQLVAHLAALELRPSVYAAEGYGSLFAYCRHVLHLSEDAAANRIHAARACLRFPVILDGLVSGDLSLSAVRMLGPHLTDENHAAVLGRAIHARREDVLKLVAELAPRPDVPSSVRKVPVRIPPEVQPGPVTAPRLLHPSAVMTEAPSAPRDNGSAPEDNGTAEAAIERAVGPAEWVLSTPPTPRPAQRASVQPLSPERYRVQFTIGQEVRDVLSEVQSLLCRDIPNGDAGLIFERALRLLHKEVKAARFGRAAKPARARKQAVTEKPAAPEERSAGETPAAAATPVATENTGKGAYEKRIRPGADSTPGARSRHIPAAVKRAVWYRDGGQCAFVSKEGHRCAECRFLELHHLLPYALEGPGTVGNIALRCRRHNAYEAELVFGARRPSTAADAGP